MLDEARAPLTAVPAHADPPPDDAGDQERQVDALHRRLAQAHAREHRAREETARLGRALERAERDRLRVEALEAQLRDPHHAEYWLDVLQSSFSWRVTRPLRWIARRRLVARLRSRDQHQ
ncbi:MAG TPA: hypothetical protein VGN78_02595 [Solirubrobacteraceae bacterium]|jgi:hypothetical protein|nr:hypothetical protein [Solirubrobacteraceae bacterium]